MITKERKNEIQKKYYQRHLDYYKEYKRQYYLKNRDSILECYKEERKAKRETRKAGITGTIKRKCRFLINSILQKK